jgi:hypothetical protein
MMGLADRLLGFIRPTRVEADKTLGTHAAIIHGGYLQSDERESSLGPLIKYKTYSDILCNTSIVAAGTRYFLNLVSRAGWRVVPANDSFAAIALAEEFHKMLHKMETPWHRVVRRAAMYRYYGFSVQEWTAMRRDDGIVSYLDVAPRAQRTIERWDVELSGRVQGMIQRSPQTNMEIYLPRHKCVYVVDDALDDSPEGVGIFRHLAEPAKRLAQYQLLEGYGYETDLRGIPIARAPLATLQQKVASGDMSSEQMESSILPLKTFVEKHIKTPELGMLLDSLPYRTEDEKGTPATTPQWALELLKGNSALSSEAVAKAIERLNRELARIMGVEHLLLGGDGKGSLALARDKTQNFALIVHSTLHELSETFQKDLVTPIWALNGWPEDLKPKLTTEAVQFRDIEQITGALSDMASAGAVLAPDDPAINEVRSILGLSEQPVVDVSLTPEPEAEEEE